MAESLHVLKAKVKASSAKVTLHQIWHEACDMHWVDEHISTSAARALT
jgi:hypothetical protein